MEKFQKENNIKINRIIIQSCNFKDFLKKEKIEKLFYKRFIGDLDSGEELDKITKNKL